MAVCGLLLMTLGCRPQAEEPKPTAAAQASAEGVRLRLLVIGDPAMADAIEKLKGEWNAQTGSTLQVARAVETDPAAAEAKDADLVICPSYHLGVLTEANRLAPIPQRLLEERSAGWGQVFPLLRTHEAKWGQQTRAVPLGSPVLMVYYRADLLEKLGARPPRTWAEYRKLAERLADRSQLGDAVPAGKPWSGTLEPLGPGWAGLDLLARAAPYAAHSDNYSTLWKIDTMDPLVDGPPFVRALEELVAVAKSGPAEQFQSDPAAVRRAFWQGQCGMALTWPTAADKTPPPAAGLRLGIAELPGAAEVYNIGAAAWETRPRGADLQVPLLAISGRVGAVTAQCGSPLVAAQFLLWLGDPQWAPQASGATPAATLASDAQAGSARAWVEKDMPSSTANQYAALIGKTLNRPQCLLALRIPGRTEYLAELDRAVAQAVRGEKTPQEALRQAAARWREITARLGLDRQRSAYLRSLNVEP